MPKLKSVAMTKRPIQRLFARFLPRHPPRYQTHSVTLHITPLDGGNALGHFRARQLLPALQAIHARIASVAARFVHLVANVAPDL